MRNLDRNITRKTDRKLTDKQIKTAQQTSPKPPPKSRKLQTNQSDRAHWFISNFWFFGEGFREVFWGVLTCFSDSLLYIFRVNVRSTIPSYYYQTLLFTSKLLFRALINQLWEYRPFQSATYTVLHAESEFTIKNAEN